MASYFRKYIPEFASRTACITKLTKKDQKWSWGQEQEVARQYVIDHLASKPLLTIFDPALETELHTDASATGYGAILMQRVNGTNRVVAYFSRRTTIPESKYHSYELESLAIYNALKHFRVYLLGIKFKIITDCNAIKSTVNKKDLTPRVARLWTYLQDFDFVVVYKKGKYVAHVDFLSRNAEEPRKVPQNTVPPSVNAVNLVSQTAWLESAQQKDLETQNLIEKVQSGEVDSNQYILKNNLLYYKNGTEKPKLYVPKGSRLGIVRMYHDENCHIGFEKTMSKVCESFWFPGMTNFIKKYISHCLVCIETKTHSGPKQGLLHPIAKNPIPFHTIHLDCTGPFSSSSDGYKYILIVIDGFTKFCILKPLKTLNGAEMAGTLRDTISMFGTPTLVITDRGTNFNTNQIKSLFSEWQVNHHMIATGTPRSNGQVERYVLTIINMLSAECRNKSDWPSGLWKVQQSINTTVQKSTGFAPLRLLIGRNANIPCVQARLNDVVDANDTVENIDISVDRSLAKQRLDQVAEMCKKRFDSTRRDNIEYNIGDLVYVNQDHRRHDKLSPKFKGPYEIINILDNDRYSLKGKGNLRDIIIAKEKLRKWSGEWVDQNVLIESELDNSD